MTIRKLEKRLEGLAAANNSDEIKDLLSENEAVLRKSLLAQSLKGALYFNEGVIDKARPAFERAIELGAGDETKYYLAKSCFLAGDFAEAWRLSSAVAQSIPDAGEVHLLAADSATKCGLPEEALSALRAAERFSALDTQVLVRQLHVLNEFAYPFSSIAKELAKRKGWKSNIELAATVVPIALNYEHVNLASDLFAVHRNANDSRLEKKFLDYSEANVLALNGEIHAALRLIEHRADTDSVEGGDFGYLREKLSLLQRFRSGVVVPRDIGITFDQISSLAEQWRMNESSQHSGQAIVFFHYETPHELGVTHTHIDYSEVISRAISAAKAVQPDAQIIMIQNEATPADFGQDVTWPVVFANPSHLMFNRFTAYAAIHQNLESGAQVAFLDSDVILFQDPFETLEDADLALTYRITSDCLMPYNEGVIVTRGSQSAKAFFDRWAGSYEVLLYEEDVLSFYRRHHDLDVQSWRGGQLSLALACGYHSLNGDGQSRCVDAGGSRVRLLPCFPNNATARIAADVNVHRRNGVRAVHLKGDRKAL